MKASRTTAGALSSLVLSLALLLAGCSGDDPGNGPPSGGSTVAEPSAAPTFRVAPVVRVGRVVGRLSKKHQESAEQQVSRAVLRWIDRAYLSTDASTLDQAFGDFSSRLRARALRDRDVMSNDGIGGITRIAPTVLQVTTDFLGVKGRPAGATSRVLLRYRTIGDERHHVTVGGRLSLVHDSHGWQVISYDVHRGVR